MRLRFLILPMAAALLGTAAGAQSTPTAYWVCKLEVSVASRMGTRLTLHGQGKRRYIENNIYYASFQTRDDQGAWPAKSAAYAQGFKAAIVAAGHPVTSEGGAPASPYAGQTRTRSRRRVSSACCAPARRAATAFSGCTKTASTSPGRLRPCRCGLRALAKRASKA